MPGPNNTDLLRKTHGDSKRQQIPEFKLHSAETLTESKILLSVLFQAILPFFCIFLASNNMPISVAQIENA
jgi:drug/metabolite transporter (DMT)-like permease